MKPLALLLLAAAGCKALDREAEVSGAMERWHEVRAQATLHGAAELYEAGLLAEARIEIETAIERGVEDGRLHVFLARIALDEGRYTETEDELARAEALEPDEAQVHLVRARLFEVRGRWDDAASSYASAAEDAPDEPAIVLAQARAAHLAGRGDDARALLEQARDTWPVSVAVVYGMADFSFRANDRARARAELERALGMRPKHVPSRRLLGLLDHVEGRHPHAVAALEALDGPDLPRRFRLALARSALVLERYDLAAETLRRYIDLEPADAEAWFEVARAHFLADRDEAAGHAVRQALMLRPRQPEAVALLGHVRFRRGAWARALEAYEASVALGASEEALREVMDEARAKAGR